MEAIETVAETFQTIAAQSEGLAERAEGTASTSSAVRSGFDGLTGQTADLTVRLEPFRR